MSKHYKEDLQIDMNSLESEWEKQPVIFIHWAEGLAEANKEKDRTKQQLEIVTAELDKEARTSGEVVEEYGKLTETAIKGWIVLQDSFQQAQEDYNEAKHEAAILSAAVSAMEQKKSALENLVKLWAAGYYSTPREPNMDKNIQEKRTKRQRGGLNKKKKK